MHDEGQLLVRKRKLIAVEDARKNMHRLRLSLLEDVERISWLPDLGLLPDAVDDDVSVGPLEASIQELRVQSAIARVVRPVEERRQGALERSFEDQHGLGRG